jgi:hypothetical protein
MDWLWSRDTMIALAIVGGVLSIAAMVMQGTGRAGPELVKRVNRAAYGFMLASVAIFIVAGFRGPA